MEPIQKVRGMQDILPDTHLYHTFLKKVFRHELRKNGFKRITTPILEHESLFTRAIGAGTDVIDKEMYQVIDRKGRVLVMKPEGTAGAMRAYIEHDMQSEPQPVYLYYVEPHFRYDRPQKGRYRQFFQIGAEIIGENDPILDAQMIHIVHTVLSKIGLKDKFTIKINSIGTAKEREKYIQALQDFYADKESLLSEDAKRKLATNPLRILDTKLEDEIILASQAPKIVDYLKEESATHYKKVKEYLDLLNIPYTEDHTLVRGLDYYTHTVFEFVDNSGRSQDTFCGGGRYDALAKKIGSPKDVPAIGWALGMERLIDALIEEWIQVKNKDRVDLYFIQIGDEAKKVVLPLTLEAREAGINTLASLGTPSMKAQMKKANRLKARYVVTVGMLESKSGIYQLKDMVQGTQQDVKKEDLIATVVEKLGDDRLDFYCPAKEFMI